MKKDITENDHLFCYRYKILAQFFADNGSKSETQMSNDVGKFIALI